MARAAHAAAFHTAPATKVELDTLVGHASQRNHTLWRYFFPEPGNRSSIDVHANWLPHTSQCVHSSECWCGHVNGSKHRGTNPHPTECEAGLTGSKMSMVLRTANCVPSKLQRKCHCITGRGQPCLYSDMNPGTTLATIALMRAAGIDHIIEEGREGGLSAYLYWLHGFQVTSVEYLPEYEPLQALRLMAPGMALLHGDGKKIIPALVNSMTAEQAARTMVFYDGEKRIVAHKSYMLVRDKVGLAAFDDSEYPAFRSYLDQEKEVWWETRTQVEEAGTFRPVVEAVLRTPEAAKVQGASVGAPGAGSHTTFVVGGGWKWRGGRDKARSRLEGGAHARLDG